MARPFTLLRARLMEHGIEQSELCGLLERCPSYVSNRMMARFPWNLEEMELIMNLIGEPWENVPKIFPRRGRDNESRSI